MRRLTALVVALFALTACSAPAASGPGPAAPAAAASDLLSFTATTLDGKTFDGTSLADKPAVLWFWAPWCATCASQGWAVSAEAPKYAGTVPIVGVAGLSDDKAAMRSFVTDTETAMIPQLDDGAGELWRKFEITEQSTYVMLDADGKIVHRGWLDDQDFSGWLEKLAA